MIYCYDYKLTTGQIVLKLYNVFVRFRFDKKRVISNDWHDLAKLKDVLYVNLDVFENNSIN